MPKRTNQFQQIIADVYRTLSPVGATFEESALIPDEDGTLREVDILIKINVAGAEISLAVECRDYDRRQSIEWVDSLIGKYDGLRVDKVIAVSSSGFSEAAILKAARERIQCMSTAQAENVDWAQKFCEPWKSLHYNMRIFHLSTYGRNEVQLTHTALDEDWKAQHDDALSEELFPTIYRMFWDKFKDQAKQKHDEYIAAAWTEIPDGKKGYFEVIFETEIAIYPPKQVYMIKRVLAGIGVTYGWKDIQTYSQVLHDHVATKIESGPANLTIVRNMDGDVTSSFFRVSELDH